MSNGRRAAWALILLLVASELTSFFAWNGGACRPLAPPLVASGLVAVLAAIVPTERLGRAVGVGVAVAWTLVAFGRDLMEVFGIGWWWAPGLGLGAHVLLADAADTSPSDPILGGVVLLACMAVVLVGTVRERWLNRLALLVVVAGTEYRIQLYIRCLEENL